MITYHLPLEYWNLLSNTTEFNKAPEWDGHTANDVIDRITEYLKSKLK